jgi:hypothetical protein
MKEKFTLTFLLFLISIVSVITNANASSDEPMDDGAAAPPADESRTEDDETGECNPDVGKNGCEYDVHILIDGNCLNKELECSEQPAPEECKDEEEDDDESP